jgi:hypothetical protein
MSQKVQVYLPCRPHWMKLPLNVSYILGCSMPGYNRYT